MLRRGAVPLGRVTWVILVLDRTHCGSGIAISTSSRAGAYSSRSSSRSGTMSRLLLGGFVRLTKFLGEHDTLQEKEKRETAKIKSLLILKRKILSVYLRALLSIDLWPRYSS